jgi:predicted transcriptional regulator
VTTKDRILRMVQGLSDDVTYKQVIYHLKVMEIIEERVAEADRGELIEHEEVFTRLLEDDAESEALLDDRRQSRPAKAPGTNRSRRAKNGRGLRSASKGRRKEA